MSEFVKFYQGAQTEYENIKNSGKLEDYFYFTVDDDGKYRLYLNEQLIFSSNNQEDLATQVISSQTFTQLIDQYLPLAGGTVTGNLTVNKTVKVDSLDATNNISAKNFKHNSQADTVIIPCALTIDKDTTINAKLILDEITVNTQGTLNKCTLNEVQNITFKDDLVLTSLPKHQSVNGYNFDFDNGNLAINTMTANLITINGKKVLTEEENAATKVYKNIQIGNIILSDDGNGNLAITSVE